MLKPEPLAQALTIVTARRPEPTGVLGPLDADDDCAVDLARYATSRRTAMHTSP